MKEEKKAEEIDGNRGNDPIDKLMTFIEGADSGTGTGSGTNPGSGPLQHPPSKQRKKGAVVGKAASESGGPTKARKAKVKTGAKTTLTSPNSSTAPSAASATESDGGGAESLPGGVNGLHRPGSSSSADGSADADADVDASEDEESQRTITALTGPLPPPVRLASPLLSLKLMTQ